MFRFVENKKKWVQIGLIVTSVPLVATGMMGSLDRLIGGGADLVHIEGGRSIPELLFDQRWSAYQQQSGKQGTLKLSERRQLLLDAVIQDQLFALYSARQRFTVSDQSLRSEILRISAFQDEKGLFSLSKYKELLKQSGQSEGDFESRVRESILRKPIDAVGRAWIAQPLVDYQLRAYETKRTIRRAIIGWEPYAKSIEVDAAAAHAYYTQHQKSYLEPEKIRVESLEISPELAEKAIVVTPEMVKEYYEKHKAEYLAPETRKVKHILLKIDAALSPAEKAKKKEKIETFLKALKAAPDKFAEYAKLYSEDPGSAAEGGDLGDVSRGMMVKPFEEAVFGASLNALVGPVETEFGYHLIQVTNIKSSGQKTFEELKESIEMAVRQEQARNLQEAWLRRLEQAKDNIDGLAKELKLVAKHSEWTSQAELVKSLDLKPSVVDQLIDAAKQKDYKVFPLQELKGQRFVWIRPSAYQASYEPTFEVVKSRVMADVQKEKAIAQAKVEGEKKLKALQSTDMAALASLTWLPVETMSFRQSSTVPDAMKSNVMAASPKNGQPVYVGAVDPSGYVIVSVDAVIPPEINDSMRRQMRDFMTQMATDTGRTALGHGLRKLYSVKINESRWKEILAKPEETPATLD